MRYDDYIMRILAGVGSRGIHVRLLSKQVYNLCATLFDMPELDEIHHYVRKYLTRNSKFPASMIERMGKRGYYRLNPNSTEARRKQFELGSTQDNMQQDGETEEKPSVDLSLNLFDFD